MSGGHASNAACLEIPDGNLSIVQSSCMETASVEALAELAWGTETCWVK